VPRDPTIRLMVGRTQGLQGGKGGSGDCPIPNSLNWGVRVDEFIRGRKKAGSRGNIWVLRGENKEN